MVRPPPPQLRSFPKRIPQLDALFPRVSQLD